MNVIELQNLSIGYGKKSIASGLNLTFKSGEIVTNWLYSVATVGVWNIIIGTTFALPVAAFHKAANQQAVLIQDLTWQWEYNFEVFADQYQGFL